MHFSEVAMKKIIHLSFPARVSDEDIDYLYNLYKDQFPNELRQWEEVERDYEKLGSDPLLEIQKHVLQFLKENTVADDLTSMSLAWSRLRTKVIENPSVH
jgi:hypothetical protein